VFYWGKRTSAVGEREAELGRTEETVKRVKQRVSIRIEESYRDIELAEEICLWERGKSEVPIRRINLQQWSITSQKSFESVVEEGEDVTRQRHF